jgi:uncharacterized protein
MDFADLLADTVPRLRAVRVARGLSQRQLEQRAGLATSSVSHFESGRRVPDAAQKWRLADALGVDVDVVFPDRTGR